MSQKFNITTKFKIDIIKDAIFLLESNYCLCICDAVRLAHNRYFKDVERWICFVQSFRLIPEILKYKPSVLFDNNSNVAYPLWFNLNCKEKRIEILKAVIVDLNLKDVKKILRKYEKFKKV